MLVCRLGLAIAIAVAFDAATPLQLQPKVPDVLYEGATFRKSATVGDTHTYEAVLTDGDILEISASQDQVGVSLSVNGPDGAPLHRIDVPDINPLPERLILLASFSGRYVVEVHVDNDGRPPVMSSREPKPPKPPGATSSYVLHVSKMRPADATDRSRAGCFDLLERAVQQERSEKMEGLRQAIPLYQQAAAGWRAAGDVDFEATTLEALANMTSYFTAFARESAIAHERLAEVYEQTGDRSQAVHNWEGLANEYAKVGRIVDAKAALAPALELAASLRLPVTEARVRFLLGSFEFEVGNFERARELAQEALDQAVAIPNDPVAALALWVLSRIDALAGDVDAASTRALRGVDLAKANPSVTSQLEIWLGFLYLRRAEFDEAKKWFEARLAMKTYVYRDSEAMARIGLGDVARARGDRQDARARYQAATSLLGNSNHPYRCHAERRLGGLDLEEGDLESARAHFDVMLDIATQRQYGPCEAEARANLADVAARRGDLETADREARRVVELTETFREAAGSLESRALGFGALAPAYDRAIDLAMRRAASGNADEMARALSLNEQALARGLLDRVLERRLDTQARVPAALANEYRQRHEQWRARLAELQVALQARPDAADTKALRQQVSSLELNVRDLEARIDAADPRHETFVRARPLSADAVRSVLDSDTLLLEYALGEERSYLWVVSSREIRAFTLAPRAVIETLARRVHEQLARSPAAAAESDTEWSDVDDRRALARLVLEPAASLLTTKRLVVVLTGALSLVPFSALPTPGTEDHEPLVRQYEIVQIPSASILASMRTLTAGRSPPTKLAAVFADPIFDRSDPRVQRASAAAPAHARTASTLALARLPFSRAEADAIGALAPGAVTTFVGAAATRERVVGGAVADYRFVHFATHAIVNQDVPGLTSLVLSLVDRTGHPRDGTVMLPDVYDMTLGADVVVLSGCQTALGKDIRGEGPIGLARAFMYAGTPRVVASLWPVDDLATAELMKRFYRGMLVDKRTAAAALHAAQQELAATRRWRSPYFWAPFVLQGDWR
jgi:CHAT domain-containing protein